MTTPLNQASAEQSFFDSLGIEAFVMKEIAADVPDGVEIPIGEKSVHDGKNYEVIWVEKREYQIGGKHYNTLIRLRFIS